jgi:O-antigen ligase
MVDFFLTFLLIFTPLAYGTVHLPSIIIFSIITVIIVTIYFIKYPYSLDKLFHLPIVKGGALFIILVLLQLIPLPISILRFMSPSTYNLLANYNVHLPNLSNISIYFWATVYELIKIISYSLIFLTVVARVTEPSISSRYNHKITVFPSITSYQLRFTAYLRLGLLTSILSILLHSLCDFNLHITANAFYFTLILALMTGISQSKAEYNYPFAQKIINSIILIGFFISVFSIVQTFSYNGKIYWIGKTAIRPRGPYVNYDHYAGYMELCIPLALASFIGSIATSSFFYIKGLRKKVLWFSSPEANRTLLYLFFSVIMTASLFLSTSRGGIMSFVISVAVFFFTIIIKTRRKRRNRMIYSFILVTLIVILMLIWIGPQSFLERFRIFRLTNIMEGPIVNSLRTWMWKDTMGIIRDFPFWGTGLGTFCHIFPKYRTFKLTPTWGFLRYAHNDYLQLISEMGIFGLIFIIAFIIFFIKKYIYAMRQLE